MKIAIDARPLSHELTGIGRYTSNLVKALIEKDTDVEWFLFSDRSLLIELEHYKNVKVITGNCSNRFVSTLFAQTYFPIWCKQNNINLFWSPRHHLPLALYFYPRIKKVVTVHDIVWKVFPKTMSQLGLWMEKLLFPPSIKIADKILCVSNFTQTELKKTFSISSNKMSVTTLQSFLSPQMKHKVRPPQNKQSYLLFVGTLEPRKNLHNLLLAFNSIKDCYPQLQLIIAGKNGWGNLKVSEEVDKLNISTRVEITGFISDEKLVELYLGCEALMMPSLYEGFGLPALEALSLGRKVVVGQKNAIVDFSGDNIYITKTDPQNIVDTTCYALNDTPENLAEVSSDWKIVAEQTYQVFYKELQK